MDVESKPLFHPEVNQAVAAQIEKGEPVSAPGVPENYPDAKKLGMEDCIKPVEANA